MIYLFVILFIIELFAVTMVCAGIMFLDKKVRNLTEIFKVNRHSLKFKLRAVYDVSNTLKIYIKAQKRYFIKQRQAFIRSIIQGFLLTMSLFFFRKTKFRNKILFVEFLLVLYDIFRADCTA